jgi:hypothetical protein
MDLCADCGHGLADLSLPMAVPVLVVVVWAAVRRHNRRVQMSLLLDKRFEFLEQDFEE